MDHTGSTIVYTFRTEDYPGTDLQKAEASPASSPKPPVLCPVCKQQTLKRKQELERHIASRHLPNWIYCPSPSCPEHWRGNRKEEFKKHTEKEKGSCQLECDPSHALEQAQYKIYETKLIAGWIIEGHASFEVAESYALDFAREMAIELGKEEVWRDLGLWVT